MDGREADGDDGAVTLLEHGGLILLDGPADLVGRLVASEPALVGARKVAPTGSTATGALASLASLAGLAGLAGAVGSAPTLFQLDEVGLELFKQGQLAQASVGDGFLRLFGHAAEGGVKSHGAVKPVAVLPQQVLSAQMALTTLALTAAIKEVGAAVERVEANVERLRDLLEAEQVGDIAGANRALHRRADHLGFDGAMSDTDWHAIDDIGVAVEQQIERLRSFVHKRLRGAEAEGPGIGDRADALELVGELAETLALLVVAQDSLFTFQHLRLARIRTREADHLDSAIGEAQALLDGHRAEDKELISRAREVVSERTTVGALEIHRVMSARAIVARAAEIDSMLEWFADQRMLDHDALAVPAIPGIADAWAEAKGRGTQLAGSARRGVSSLQQRVRRRSDDATDVLPAGDTTDCLPSGVDEGDAADELAPPGGSRVERARQAAASRLRRPRRQDDDQVDGDA